MKSVLNTVLKLLGILVLLAVVAGIAIVVFAVFSWGHHVAVQAALQKKQNSAIEVVRMYASPPNGTLAWRFFLVKNTSGKTITAIKFRVTVYNQLKRPIDRTTVRASAPIAPGAEVYCDLYTLFDLRTGLPVQSGGYVDRTDKRLVDFAEHQVGCQPQALQVTRPYQVKVLSIAYAAAP